MRVFVGIDWGSRVHSLCVLDADGERLWEGEVQHQGDAIRAAVEKIVAFAEGDAAQLSVCMEAPHGSFVEAFVDRGAAVFHINPKQLDRFRDRYSNAGAKDDALDAFVLANTLRTDRALYRQVVISAPALLTLREVSRTYEAITKQTMATANQVRDQLRRYFPQMLELGDWHKEAWLWALFDKAPVPAAVPSLSTSWIKRLLKNHRIRRYKPLEIFTRLNEIPLPVADGVAQAASEHVRLLLPILRAQHQQRMACSERLEQLLSSAAEEEPVPDKPHRDATILLSLPGIGIHNGATMLAEATVALQERDYQDFRRLSAVAPVSSRTGGKNKRPLVRQRRCCNGRLRTAVFHWAAIASRHDLKAKHHYEAMRAKGHNYARALRGVADRLIQMLFSMLKAGELYDPARRMITS